jgi:hypothetical protein
MPASNINIISVQQQTGKNLFTSGYCELGIHPSGIARDVVMRGGGSQPAIKWILPIPKGFNDVFDNEWNPVEVGPLGALAANKIMDIAQGKGLSINANELTGLGANAAVTALSSLGLQGLLDKAAAVKGLQVNPYTQLSYKSPALRQFQFSWNIVPISSNEAQLIQRMVSDIRKYSYPTISSIGGFYEFPAEFTISIVTKEGIVLLQTAPSACTSLQVNYDTEGAPYIHKDGRPVSTTITISIQEAFLLDRTKIENMYDQGKGPV